MKKRILSLLLALIMALSMMPGAYAAEGEVTDRQEPSVTETQPVQSAKPSEEPSPAASQPAESETAEPRPTESQPTETEPTESEPDETEPAETEPTETEPTESEPVETEPTETEPSETEPAETTGPKLNSTDHIAYISGRGNGTFDPNGNLTRAEAATMIYKLLASTDGMGDIRIFSDVKSGAWYYDAVTTLASLGILNGYSDGSFCPNQTVTRAEFVKILSGFFALEEGENPFSDVAENYWAKDVIVSAVAKGWLKGYEDGTFRPARTITRAEAATVINAALGRSAAAEETLTMLEQGGVDIFADVQSGKWYYAAVMEAAIPHSYTGSGEQEIWTLYSSVTCGLSEGLHKIDGYYYHVNADGQFDRYSSGFQTIDGVQYYVDSQGRIPATASVQTVDGVKYYIDSQGRVAAGSAGAKLANGKLWYVDDAGKVVSYSAGLQEIDGDLYNVLSDGSLMYSDHSGYLTFGADGKYTSGDSDLDALVDKALAACTSSDMSQSEKLRAAYLYIRDNCTYLSRSHQARGSTSWTVESATFMLTYMKGNCYCYAASFLYMARRLGYQAYPISGGVGTKNSDHAWVMISWSDGKTYLFDVELEYAYRYRYANKQYYDLYKISASSAPFVYHFPS